MNFIHVQPGCAHQICPACLQQKELATWHPFLSKIPSTAAPLSWIRVIAMVRPGVHLAALSIPGCWAGAGRKLIDLQPKCSTLAQVEGFES